MKVDTLKIIVIEVVHVVVAHDDEAEAEAVSPRYSTIFHGIIIINYIIQWTHIIILSYYIGPLVVPLVDGCAHDHTHHNGHNE
jgi:hypothetical protein